jgi:hypothetical protein
MKYHYLMVALLVALAVLAAGCTGGGTTNATTTAPTAAPGTVATTAAAVTTAAPATLETLPAGQSLGISVNRQPLNREIDVTFNGGSAQGSVRAMEVTVVRSDGTTETKPLKARQGAEVTFTGTRGVDTVTVTATMTNGRTYRFFEQSLAKA